MTRIFGYYFSKPLEQPVRLEPGVTYHVLAVSNGGDITTASDDSPPCGRLRRDPGGIRAAAVADPKDPKSWKISAGKPGSAFGPVGFLYTFDAVKRSDTAATEGQPGRHGVRRGRVSTQVTFPKAGHFALTFHATGKNPFQVWVDDQNTSALAQNDHRIPRPPRIAASAVGAATTASRKSGAAAVFEIKRRAPTVTGLVGVGKSEKEYVVFDNIRVNSLDAIMESGFGGGSTWANPWRTNGARATQGYRHGSVFRSAAGLLRAWLVAGRRLLPETDPELRQTL